MKKSFYALATLVILLLSNILPVTVLADTDVPQIVINARQSVYRVFCENENYYISGSSFVVFTDQQDTYLATNYHVVEDADRDSIIILSHDGEELPASIVDYNKTYDLCLLKTETPILEAASLPLSEVHPVGMAIYALGFPGAADALTDETAYMPDDVTVTNGIINSIRELTLNGSSAATLLQINAAINPGSSGGPLLDSTGKVVGINTLGISGAQETNGAVSVSHLITMLNDNYISYQTEYSEGLTSHYQAVLIWSVCGVIFIALGILFMILVHKTRTNQRLKANSLTHTMERRLFGYSPDQAIRKLFPVFETLYSQHSIGNACLCIEPSNLYIDTDGTLHLMNSKKIAITGENQCFFPAELYSPTGIVGTWSDIYSLAAVMHYMITTNPPVSSHPQMNRIPLPSSYTSQTEERVWECIRDSLSLDIRCRPQNILEFLHTLGQNAVIEQLRLDKRTAKVTRPYMSGGGAPGKKSGIFRFGVAAAACVLILAILTGGSWAIYEQQYQQALTLVDKNQFSEAYEVFTLFVPFYKDMDELEQYLLAGRDMENGEYEQAKELFSSLDSYRKSQTMILECDYRYGRELLKQGDFITAQEVFTLLEEYRQSPDLVLECQYLRSLDFLEKGEFYAAQTIMEALEKKNYRNAKQLVLEIKYQQAQDLFRTRHFMEARNIFIKLERDNYKDSALMHLESEYQLGLYYFRIGNYLYAKSSFFTLAGYDYKDAESRYLESEYLWGLYNYNQFLAGISGQSYNYDSVEEYAEAAKQSFSSILYYSDSRTQLNNLIKEAHQFAVREILQLDPNSYDYWLDLLYLKDLMEL